MIPGPTPMPRGLYCDRWPVEPSTLIHSIALSTGEVVEIYAPERLSDLLKRKAQEILDEADANGARPILELIPAGHHIPDAFHSDGGPQPSLRIVGSTHTLTRSSK